MKWLEYELWLCDYVKYNFCNYSRNYDYAHITQFWNYAATLIDAVPSTYVSEYSSVITKMRGRA